jgi:hypothetical protein
MGLPLLEGIKIESAEVQIRNPFLLDEFQLFQSAKLSC